jgi:hypothetical protein
MLAVLTVAVAASLTAGGVQWEPAPATKPRVEAPNVATVAVTEAEAATAARKTGRKVEVAGARSDRTTLYAHPDGTFTREHHVRPIRTVKNGAWVPVDATLVRNTDGTYGPKAATVDLAVSAGGDGPLATLSRMGRQLSFYWPGRLPAPVVEGRRATYRNVIPGVDLVVNTDVFTFSHVLVVKTPQAAERLGRITYRLAPKRLTVTAKGGHLIASDPGSNTVVFQAPPPVMWDSGTGPAPGEELDPARSAPESARRSPVGVAVDDGRLVLTPDPKLLANPSLRYPIYIDPVWGPNEYQGSYTMVDSGYPNNVYWLWQNAGNSDNQRVGLCPSDTSSDCNSSKVKRLLYDIPTGNYADDAIEIIQANFSVTLKHVENTWATYGTELWAMSGGIYSGTTWNSQPGWLAKQSTTWSLGTQACSVSSRNLTMDATDALRRAADGNWSVTTFGMKADNEGWMRNNRRFCHNAFVSVHYNKKPTAPTTLTSNPGGDCKTGASAPYVGKPPVLSAYLSDPDTGDGEPLTAEFSVTWTPPGGSAQTKKWESLQKPNQSFVDYDLNLAGSGIPGLPQNTRISWNVRTSDGIVNGAKSWSPYSASCEFIIDTTKPAGPDIDSVEYLPGDATDDGDPANWSVCKEEIGDRDGVGRYGTFTFKSADTDVARYKYGFDTTPNRTIDAGTGTGKPATVTWMPTTQGPHRIFVRAVDAAGLESPDAACTFKVSKGSAPTAHWRLDDKVGSTQAIDSRGGKHATAGSGVTFGAIGPNGLGAARLDGSAGAYLTSSTLGLVDTGKPFTVSAWAKLEDEAANQTILSQDASGTVGFQLTYDGGSKKWGFGIPSTDGNVVGGWGVSSTTTAAAGKWTLLVASFDPVADRITLEVKVDGVAGAPVTTAIRSQWASHGHLQIGRRLVRYGYGDHWKGELAEIAVYARITTLSEIALQTEAKRVGYWDFDSLNANQSATREYVERQNSPDSDAADAKALAVHGAQLIEGGEPQNPEDPPGETPLMGEGHLRFVSGEQDHLASSAQLFGLRTSFTVATRARLVGLCTNEQVVLSQPGSVRSRFKLRCKDGRWELAMTRSNDTGSTETIVYGRAGDADYRETGQHLAVTFNAVDGTVTLYVDGQIVQTATGVHTAIWNGTLGGLQVGRGRLSDGSDNGGYFSGDADEVRVYSGVLTSDQVALIAGRTVLPDR